MCTRAARRHFRTPQLARLLTAYESVDLSTVAEVLLENPAQAYVNRERHAIQVRGAEDRSWLTSP